MSRYDDVVAALRRPLLFSSAARTRTAAGSVPSLLFMDPPEHSALRRVVSRAFTPREVTWMEAAVTQAAVELATRLSAQGGGDFVADFAAPLPVAVVLRLLGVREDERARVSELLSGQQTPGVAEELRAYWSALSAAERRAAGPAGGGGLVAELVRAEGGGGTDGRRPLSDEEVAAFCSLVGQAGTESVAMLLSNSLVLFARHPEQWRVVCGRPEAIPAAVEEVLRFWAPTQHQGRVLTDDVALHGRRMPAGSHVLLLIGSAGRDERAYPEPDVFDIDRFGPGRRPSAQAAFGFGAHFCVGAALARLQARIALEEFSKRFPCFDLDEGKAVRSGADNGFGYENLPFQA